MTRHISPLLSALAAVLLLASCATGPAEQDAVQDEASAQDPIEGFNRGVYAFNNVVDAVLLEPVARLYRVAVPAPGREGVKNFLTNLSAPVVLINNVLQGDVNGAFTTFWRFVLNSTLGFGGVYDFASNNTHLQYRSEDFGQTLGVWGMGSGPYLVLPILGPSSVRDGSGRVVDYVSDPFTYLLTDGAQIGRYAATAIDGRSRTLDLVDEIEKNSLDPYATIRSAYLQKRQAQVENKGGSSDSAQSFGPVTGPVEDEKPAPKPRAEMASPDEIAPAAGGMEKEGMTENTADMPAGREDNAEAARTMSDGTTETNTNAVSGRAPYAYGRIRH